MKEKRIIYILSILTIVFTVIGSTLAYYNWETSSSQRTNVVFTATADFSCSADGGGDITSDDVQLVPTSCTNSTYAIKRKVTVSPTITSSDKTIMMDLWLKVNTMGTGLSQSQNFNYAFTRGSTSCTDNVVTSGNFNSTTTGSQITLFESKTYSSSANETYYLWIWLDNAETSTSTMNQEFSLSLGGMCTDDLTPKITVTALVAAANPTTLTYESATDEQKANMWAVEHEATSQTSATTDYRYIGASPNNWIKFNGDEYWRIIGVFDGKIKIISNSNIGGTNYYFDYKQTGVGSSTSSYGSNDWTDAQLMYMLNAPIYKNTDGTYNTTLLTSELLKTGYTIDENNYIKDTASNIIYQLGKIPASIASGATSYSGTDGTWSLTNEAINQIEKSTFYLGGTSSTSNSASAWYNAERGITTPNSNTNPTNWTGYVGLMYPSDYAYTYAYGVDDTCFSNTYNCTATLGAKSWLYQDVISTSSHPWTISPMSSITYYIFRVRNADAIVDYRGSARNAFGAHSSIYLKSNIKLKGKGTYEEPYEIVG